jgi:Ca2+/Na+ antiporter
LLRGGAFKTAVVILVLFLAISLLIVTSGDFSALFVWLAYFLFSVLYYVFIISRSVNSKENSKWFLPAQYEFKDNEIVVTNPLSKETFLWSALVKWRKAANYYLLYSSKTNFYAIAIDKIEDKNAFEKMLSEKVTKP